MSAAMISIYLPDDGELRKWLDLFERHEGFVETDWCELTKPGSGVIIVYGPARDRDDPAV